MKLKRLPEDFQVEEQVSLVAAAGPFALYRLTKHSLGTLEAIDAIMQRWNLDRRQIAFAGLKDKHALTRQYVTIHEGPKRGLAQTNFELEYLGHAPRPIHASDIVANRFSIVVRDLADGEVAAAEDALAAVARDGLSNYFDDQRFGSLGMSGEFIAKPWCLGDYERALWLAIADNNEHDRPRDREEKQILRDHWGNWNKCRDLLGTPQSQTIVSHLARQPGDFRRAIALVRADIRSLWLAAFQSDVWNQILAALIERTCQPSQRRCVAIGRRELPLAPQLTPDQRDQLTSTMLPLPSARQKLHDGPLKRVYDEVLAREGLELRQIRVKYPRDSFFSKGERPAIFRPSDVSHELSVDELYPGSQKLTLCFALPRASYATIVIKRVFGQATTGDDDDDNDA
jgi:tRNA pseudouridine13 synthase